MLEWPVFTPRSGAENVAVAEIFVPNAPAAVISPVGKLHFRGEDIAVNDNQTGPVARDLHSALTGIQYGTREDTFGWTETIET